MTRVKCFKEYSRKSTRTLKKRSTEKNMRSLLVS